MASKQSRLQGEGRQRGGAWGGVLELGGRALSQGPSDGADVQGSDKWLNEILFCDPVLPGMIAKLTSALAGQAWKVVGGRNTALRVSHVLENADGGRGWFHFCEAVGRSYLCRDMGSFVELERVYAPQVDADGELRNVLAPVTALYNMDSTKARWVRAQGASQTNPLRYEGQVWGQYDFFHLVDWSGDTDATRRRGYCPLHRCVEYVKLLSLITTWEHGNLDPDFIDAILLLTGADDEQFNQAMAAREQVIESRGNAAKRLAVIANLSDEVKAELLFLRRRPESLEQFEARVRMIYEVYAMNLGRDITFWFPTANSGKAYRTKNEILGEERASVESNVFHPKLQEALQRYVIPQTVHFEIENPAVSDRDELFRLREFAEVAKTLYESHQSDTMTGEREYLVTRDEMRLYLAEADARFGRLTTEQKSVSQTDNDMDLARALPAVQTLVDGYRRGWWPDEILIERSWERLPSGRETVAQRALPWSVADLAQPKIWVVAE